MADLAAQPTSVQSIYNLYREDKLFVNRRYQRKLVWTLEEKRRLIESIVCKYPIPAILIAETKAGGTFEIIDGLQRLHAIVSYIESLLKVSMEPISTSDSFLPHLPTLKQVCLRKRAT